MDLAVAEQERISLERDRVRADAATDEPRGSEMLPPDDRIVVQGERREVGAGHVLGIVKREEVVDAEADIGQVDIGRGGQRWEERRDGQGGVSVCRTRGEADELKKKYNK